MTDDDGIYIHKFATQRDERKSDLAKIQVAMRSVGLEELADKINAALDLYRRAMERYKRGMDFVEEWEKCITVLELERKNLSHYTAVSHHNIGVIHARQSRYDQATLHFREALKIDPNYALAAFNLGVTLERQGDPVQAQIYIQKAHDLGYEPKRKG